VPLRTICPAQQFIGLVVADDRFLLPVPLDAAAELKSQHAQQRHGGGAVPTLNVIDRRAARSNAVDEVGPKLADVLTPKSFIKSSDV
jgi:hypothetical protein